MTYEETYAELCVGCEHEKECHEECVLCGKFYEFWEEDE